MSRVTLKGGRIGGLLRKSRQARWAIASQIVTSTGNFATTIIIVRELGLAEFGRFSVCFLLMMVMRNFLNGMVLLPMSTIGPKLSMVSRSAYGGFLAANAFVFSLISSLLLIGLSGPLGTVLNAPWLSELSISFALANFTANGSDFLRRYHFVYEAPVRAFSVDVVRFAVQLAFLGCLTTIWMPVFSADTALYAMAAGGLAGTLVGLINYGQASWSPRLNLAVWPRHWNFIKWAGPNVGLEVSQNVGIVLMGGAMLGEATLGGVRAMQNLANTINLPFNAFQQIAASLASRAFKAEGHAGLRRLLAILATWSLVFVLIITTAIVTFSGPLIRGLFGISVEQNLPHLLLFCIVNGLIALRFPITVGLQSIEKPVILVMGGILSSAIGITALLLLAPAIEAIAIPATRVIVVTASLLILVVLSRPHFRLRGSKQPQDNKPSSDWRKTC